MDELLNDFALEAAEALREIRAAVGVDTPTALRRLHGLKGAAACMGLGEIEIIAHQLEDQLAAGQAMGLDRLETAIVALKASPGRVVKQPDAAIAFAGLERMARDLGLRLGKRIELIATGAETPLPATAAAKLRTVLVAGVADQGDQHGAQLGGGRRGQGRFGPGGD